MQEPTHILAGAIIQKSLDTKKHRKLALGLTAVLAFLSHGLLDKLANLTFHPPKPDFHSVFWISYHIIVAVMTIVFLWLWWEKYKWGITFAMLPDLDWVFIHGQEIFHVQIPFYRHPYLHHFVGFIYEKIPPLSWVTPYLDRLPSYRHDPLAALTEVLLVAVLLLTLRLMTLAQRPASRLEMLAKT